MEVFYRGMAYANCEKEGIFYIRERKPSVVMRQNWNHVKG